MPVALEEAQPLAVAHRVVHGGSRFAQPVVVDEGVRAALGELAALAPLHSRPALAALDDARAALPGVPHVAVFDTAYHETLPPAAREYALPRAWREAGIRRYGFHGLSVQSCAERLPVERLVVCHLGGGCSLTAVRDGRSVDTTMGFSPLDGVPMATRPGAVDPGVLLHLLREGTTQAELERGLEHESGFLGLGGTASMQELEARAAGGDPAAGLALSVFVHRVAGAAAAMAAATGGLDALAFTGGIGERSALVRQRVCGRLAFLGVRLDEAANAAAEPDVDVAARGPRVRVHVLAAREELVAARAALALLAR
jgi:acetate kinase